MDKVEQISTLQVTFVWEIFSGFFFFCQKKEGPVCAPLKTPHRKQIKWVIDFIEICSVFDMGE